jgi:hypothetical protein
MSAFNQLNVPRRKVSFSKELATASVADTTPIPSPRKAAPQRPPLKLSIPKQQYNVVNPTIDVNDKHQQNNNFENILHTTECRQPVQLQKSTFKPTNIHNFLGMSEVGRKNSVPKIRKYSTEEDGLNGVCGKLSVDMSNNIRSIKSAPIKNECDVDEARDFFLNGFMMNSNTTGENSGSVIDLVNDFNQLTYFVTEKSPLMKFLDLNNTGELVGTTNDLGQFMPMSKVSFCYNIVNFQK